MMKCNCCGKLVNKCDSCSELFKIGQTIVCDGLHYCCIECGDIHDAEVVEDD